MVTEREIPKWEFHYHVVFYLIAVVKKPSGLCLHGYPSSHMLVYVLLGSRTLNDADESKYN